LSTLKVLWKKIKPPSALYFQGLKAVFINTFCPITPKKRYLVNMLQMRHSYQISFLRE